MRREFICHRCGRANGPAVENCAYCGLQVGWRPTMPALFRFRRWTAAQRDMAGAGAAILAAGLESALSLSILTLPLLAFSSLLLIWSGRAGDGMIAARNGNEKQGL